MILQCFESEEEVERRRRGVEMVLDKGEVVRLFLGSVAGAGLCSSPQWAHCREICRRLRFSFPSTTESRSATSRHISAHFFISHVQGSSPISWSEIHNWNGRVPTSMATSYCINI
jgi:hypothetical protein